MIVAQVRRLSRGIFAFCLLRPRPTQRHFARLLLLRIYSLVGDGSSRTRTWPAFSFGTWLFGERPSSFMNLSFTHFAIHALSSLSFTPANCIQVAHASSYGTRPRSRIIFKILLLASSAFLA